MADISTSFLEHATRKEKYVAVPVNPVGTLGVMRADFVYLRVSLRKSARFAAFD